MKTRTALARDLSDVDMSRWHALARTAIEPNLYLDPRWLHTSVTHHPDAAELRVLLVESDDGELRGLLAYSIEPAWEGLPFTAVSTAGRFLATHAERHHPLIDRADPAGVVGAMLDAMPAAGGGLAVLRKFPGDGPLWEALTAATAQRGVPLVENLRRPSAYSHAGAGITTVLDPDFSIPLASTRSNKRMRSYSHGLTRAVGGPLALVDRSADDVASDRFLDFQSAGWKGNADEGGLAMGNSTITAQWFRAIAEAFREDGDLRVLELGSEGAIVYMTVSLASGGSWFGFLDTYADEFAPFSAGSLGRLAELNHLRREHPTSAFDPNIDPYYASSTNLYPDRRDRVDVVIAPGRLVSRSLLRAMPAVRRLRDRLKAGIRGAEGR